MVSLGQLKEKLSEMKRDASELQTMHHYHKILSLCAGCAGVGVQQSAVFAVRAGHQPLHDAMTP